MNVLFVHDGPLSVDKDKNYYGVHYTDELRIRYLNLGLNVTYMMRVREIDHDKINNYSKICNDNFKVIQVLEFKSLKLYFKNKKLVNEMVAKAVNEHDIVITRVPSALSSIAIKYALKLKKPLLTEVVACNWDALWNFSLKGKIVAPYFYFKLKKIMLSVPYSIYVTKFFLQKRYPTKGKSIYCSDVQLKNVETQSLEQRLKKIEKSNLSESLIVGTVAAVDVLYKGQSDVIKAIAKLKQIGFRIEYWIVGQGNPDYLKQLSRKLGVEELVKFIGPLKHSEIFEFYDNLDLYIQPSKQEGLPRVLIEAMSRACPAIGARTGGIPELLSEDFIFDKGNKKQLIKILKSLDKETLMEQANHNFNKSLEYRITDLNRKRFNFYYSFLSDNKLPIPERLSKSLSKQ